MARYQSPVPNQSRGVTTEFTAGLNEYTPASHIADGVFSDCLDVLPYRDSILNFHSEAVGVADLFASTANFAGYVVAAVAERSSSAEDVLYTLAVDSTNGYICKATPADASITRYSLTSLGFPPASPRNYVYDGCLYSTEATNYVVFVCSGVDKLYYFNGSAVAAVNLDFTPTRCVSHANRIFVLDNKNTLWWCKAGDLTLWYGAIGADPIVNEDAGYWTVESERGLSEMCVVNGNLFLFGTQNIYVFSGESPDNFYLKRIVSDKGVYRSYESRRLAFANNTAYFISGNYDDSTSAETISGADVLMFTGSQAPEIISRPLIASGRIINGIAGGISNTDKTNLAANENFVYLYQKTVSAGDNFIYKYDINQRTWWKISGFSESHDDLGSSLEIMYIPTFDNSQFHAIVNDLTVGYWHLFNVDGHKGTLDPYIVTKAFYANPTDDGTLSAIVISLQGTKDDSADITVEYSKTIDDTDWTEVKRYEEYLFTGDIQRIYIPMPVSAIHNCSHYRIRITIAGADCSVYGLERRFRMKGLSR